MRTSIRFGGCTDRSDYSCSSSWASRRYRPRRVSAKLDRLLTLGLSACGHHLRRGDRDLLDQAAELDPPRETLGGLGPRLAERLAVLVHVGAAGVRERELTARADGRGDNQALVLELSQRRVHRPGARAPGASASLLDLLHQLIAVAGLLGEQEQDRGTHVPARAASAPVASEALTRRSRSPRAAAVAAVTGHVGDAVLVPPRPGPFRPLRYAIDVMLSPFVVDRLTIDNDISKYDVVKRTCAGPLT